MNSKIEKMLEITNDIHIPIPIDETETAEYALEKKPIIKSRVLSDMESLENWEAVTPWAKISLSSERKLDGEHSLLFTHPTNLDSWEGDRQEENFEHMYEHGRIYGVPAARLNINNEDWREYNRVSAWVYPVAPGMKSITLRIQLFNDGNVKVPDIYLRDGAHNISLKGDCWNHVVLEFPYLDRDKVTGIAFEYDMVGHEPEAVNSVKWYIDRFELQKVEADVWEGWKPAGDRISFSGSGYQTGSDKIAIASDINADTFKLIETSTGRVVLNKPIEISNGKIGKLQVMDFSEIMEEGEYILVAGDLSTRVFRIGNDVWESSVWKTLNFFLVLRCGYEVKGKHRACHTDMLLKHGDKAVVANGGWHDAGDLAQGLHNTAEGTIALFELAEAVKGKHDRLYRRVLEEARWGLDYVLKTRFGDGYRAEYSSCSIWTDGIIGTADDITQTAVRSAYRNFDCAYAEALAAQALKQEDPDYSAYSLKTAIEDFDFGVEIEQDANQVYKSENIADAHKDIDRLEVQICSIAALAATALYKLTSEERFKASAFEYAKRVMACQQTEITDWDIPLVGFFYQTSKKDLIWHHNHMAYSYLPDLCMEALLKAFPDADEYPQWYSTLALSGEFYKAIAKFTAPYGLIPAGVFHKDEGKDYGMYAMAQHPMGEERMLEHYEQYVKNGFPLGKGYYLKVYPVWFSFRGNYNVMLSEGLCMNAGAHIRNDYDLYAIAQKQHEWIVGKNPMARSTMYGEGYDYTQLYAVQPGQTVGALSVGMESHFDRDEPYWPQVNNATYKEVWVCSATKWAWCMAYSLMPACISGYLKPNEEKEVLFRHIATGREYKAAVHSRTGEFTINLPAGKYEMLYGGYSRKLNVVSGKDYSIDGALFDIKATAELINGEAVISLSLSGEAPLAVAIRADNISGIEKSIVLEPNKPVSLKGKLIEENKPFVGIVVPNGNLADAIEFIDPRI